MTSSGVQAVNSKTVRIKTEYKSAYAVSGGFQAKSGVQGAEFPNYFRVH